MQTHTLRNLRYWGGSSVYLEEHSNLLFNRISNISQCSIIYSHRPFILLIRGIFSDIDKLSGPWNRKTQGYNFFSALLCQTGHLFKSDKHACTHLMSEKPEDLMLCWEESSIFHFITYKTNKCKFICRLFLEVLFLFIHIQLAFRQLIIVC